MYELCRLKSYFEYAQSAAVISGDVSADMQFVAFGLVFDVEEPIFDGEPVAGQQFLPLVAQSVAARGCQKVHSLQTHPEVLRAAPSKSVLVIVPHQVPIKPTQRVALHEKDPVVKGNHRDRSLSGNCERNRLVLLLEICHSIKTQKVAERNCIRTLYSGAIGFMTKKYKINVQNCTLNASCSVETNTSSTLFQYFSKYCSLYQYINI